MQAVMSNITKAAILESCKTNFNFLFTFSTAFEMKIEDTQLAMIAVNPIQPDVT